MRTTFDHIYEKLLTTLTESADPKHFVQLPRDLPAYTELWDGTKVSSEELKREFPELAEKSDIPEVYVKLLSFNDKKTLTSIAFDVISPESSVKASMFYRDYVMKQSNDSGLFYYISKRLALILISTDQSTADKKDSIYHEWKHYLQRVDPQGFRFKSPDLDTTLRGASKAAMSNWTKKHYGVSAEEFEEYYGKEDEFPLFLDSLIDAIHWLSKQPGCEASTNEELFEVFTRELVHDAPMQEELKKANTAGWAAVNIFKTCATMMTPEGYADLCREVTERL